MKASGIVGTAKRKVLHFLRHGQATHNVNAERMRHEGCSYEAFINQMREDDEFDAALTPKGISQAKEVAISESSKAIANRVGLIISSPLSRAIDTAELVLGSPSDEINKTNRPRRILREEWREISGLLVNAKRLPGSKIRTKYPNWDGGDIAEEDTLWTNELESEDACAERAYRGLQWIWNEVVEDEIAIAAHGGIFAFLMNRHPFVTADENMRRRFTNCELKSCEITLDLDQGSVGAGGQLQFKLASTEPFEL